MAVQTNRLRVETRGGTDIIDLTARVAEHVELGPIRDGSVTLFVPGSTAGLTTVEYEPGVVSDLREAWERLFPAGLPYRHNAIDDNGHSHVRAAFLGPSLTVPLVNRRLALGTWQQIVLVDFDTHPRQRDLILQVAGE
jgi:secondary thiamine-phosphate synthase enzyme